MNNHSTNELVSTEGERLNQTVSTPSIIEEIDPRSVLPQHLQTHSYDRDIWDRIKNHPLRNPTLFRDKLDGDTESREIIRQVIGAAHQRESEILLHNQSRVFGHVLARALSQLGTFMSTPLVPALRTIDPQPRDTSADTADDNSEREPPAPEKQTVFAMLFGWIVTPKYILFGLVGFLGIATGWSQLELRHLRQASESFQASVALNSELQSSMEQTINDGEKTVTTLQEQLTNAQQETASVRSTLNQAENDLKMAKQLATNKEEQIDGLKQEMAQLREATELGEDEKDKAIERLNQEKQDLATRLATAEAQLAGANAEAERLGSVEQSNHTLANQLTNERKEKNRRVAELQTQLNGLMLKEYILIDALACIKNVERELKSRWYKHDRVKKYLETFRLQEQTRRSTVQGG